MIHPSEIAVSFLPLDQVLSRALSARAAKGLYTGFGIIGLGFLLNLLRELWRDVQGQKVNYLQHVAMLIALVAFLPNYRPIVVKTIQILSHLGDTFMGPDRLDVAYFQRVNAFLSFEAMSDIGEGQTAVSVGSRPALIDALTFFCAQIACFGALYMAVFLKSLQVFMLSAVIVSGPVLIGLSMLSQFFRPLAAAWVKTLCEISFWSFAMDVLNFSLAPISALPPEKFSAIQELFLAITLIGVMAIIPAISRKLLQFERNLFPMQSIAAEDDRTPIITTSYTAPGPSTVVASHFSPKASISHGVDR